MHRYLTLVLLTLALPAPVFAQEDPDDQERDGVEGKGGDSVEPPAPKPIAAPRPGAMDDEQRRSIRGNTVEEPSQDPLKEAQRRFDLEAFGPSSEQRWSEDDEARAAAPAPAAPIGKDQPPGALRSPERATHVAPPAAPPPAPAADIAWLKSLKTGDVPIRWDPRVIAYLQFYKDDPRGRSIMTGWLKAQGRFKDMILEALRRHHLPEDLLYICMIESSYDPLDYSRAGASGLWQFMPENSRIYGLARDYWVDERNDPEKSNEAQMYYFQDLIDRFGNWHLALTAFNAGYGAVLKSLAKYGTNDFWALLDIEAGLPWESSIYVPKFLAASIIGHNLAAFGYDTLVQDAPWQFDRVTVPKSVDLSVIASAAGTDVKTIKALNPALRRGRTPPGAADFMVRIPRGKKNRFAQQFPQLRGDWDGYDAYVMRWGERFEDVARTHGVSPARLRELNGVKDPTEVRGGTVIVVPRVDEDSKKKNRAAAEVDLYHSDVVPGGPDDPLLVAVRDKDFTVPGKKRVFYRVVAGDTLEDVAGALAVDTGDLADWNGLDLDTKIQARMVLEAFVSPKLDPDARHVALLDDARLMIVTTGSKEHLDIYEGRKGRVREKYVVKDGDNLDSIGRRYFLTKYDLARINHRNYNTPVTEGEELLVYKVVDMTKAKKTGVFSNIKTVEARKGGSTKRKHAK